MDKFVISVMLGYLSIIPVALSDQTIQEISAECTTSPTGWDGARHSCSSSVSRITAPDGFVFAEKTLNGGEFSGAGDEHSCNPSFSDYVEVIPNSAISQPRTLTLYATATGPSGHNSGRGWAVCRYQVVLTKYK